ncbi:hypothetical protein HPP92_004942 [Vanilla planifolia]|uniref:Uncharacterized protein n=1 Tax=Vanilla planifolia TaxID=51239 RepID=A0A835V8L3_VANPL|nr:hypothetical protein HPP92_004942 [Vanilla planifolia]
MAKVRRSSPPPPSSPSVSSSTEEEGEDSPPPEISPVKKSSVCPATTMPTNRQVPASESSEGAEEEDDDGSENEEVSNEEDSSEDSGHVAVKVNHSRLQQSSRNTNGGKISVTASTFGSSTEDGEEADSSSDSDQGSPPQTQAFASAEEDKITPLSIACEQLQTMRMMDPSSFLLQTRLQILVVAPLATILMHLQSSAIPNPGEATFKVQTVVLAGSDLLLRLRWFLRRREGLMVGLGQKVMRRRRIISEEFGAAKMNLPCCGESWIIKRAIVLFHPLYNRWSPF